MQQNLRHFARAIASADVIASCLLLTSLGLPGCLTMAGLFYL